ncbi:MAG: sigma-70 family RNA polymerase sigma factor [Bradyrhizobium sp.]|nr:MAG: sigma-70 family RNA polymerase sigma factor [Bradyrhizobium sp.]
MTADAALVDRELKQRMVESIPRLRAFALSLCGNSDRADDLVQECLTKALLNLRSFTSGTNLSAWLFTILRNTYYSEFRRHRREVPDSDGIHYATLVSQPTQDDHMNFLDFNKAMQELPPDQREALILVGAAGFSYEEAAEICNCAIGTVKSRVSRARSQLATRLGV